MAKRKILGIIGGMGPLATVNFFHKLVELTPARKDQDHPRILIDSNPIVPDRTQAILKNGPSPVPVIVETARNLQNAGADFLAMPCATAHHYFDEIQTAVSVPIVHMIRETAKRYASDFSGKRAGLLATNGTLKTEIYQSAFPPDVVIIPDDDTQSRLVMASVYGEKGVKSGHPQAARQAIREAGRNLIADGVQLLIAGCTEISIILKPEDFPVSLLDPIHVLAEVCLEQI